MQAASGVNSHVHLVKVEIRKLYEAEESSKDKNRKTEASLPPPPPPPKNHVIMIETAKFSSFKYDIKMRSQY